MTALCAAIASQQAAQLHHLAVLVTAMNITRITPLDSESEAGKSLSVRANSEVQTALEDVATCTEILTTFASYDIFPRHLNSQ